MDQRTPFSLLTLKNLGYIDIKVNRKGDSLPDDSDFIARLISKACDVENVSYIGLTGDISTRFNSHNCSPHNRAKVVYFVRLKFANDTKKSAKQSYLQAVESFFIYFFKQFKNLRNRQMSGFSSVDRDAFYLYFVAESYLLSRWELTGRFREPNDVVCARLLHYSVSRAVVEAVRAELDDGASPGASEDDSIDSND
jgi:hypothetical protein